MQRAEPVPSGSPQGNAAARLRGRETGGPSRVHWKMLVLLMAYAFMCHFNRVSISVAGTERIIGESVSATQMGTVYSAYLVAYTLVMVPAGWLIDRRGPRFALATMGFGSAVLVALSGCASWMPNLLLSLLVVRALLGVVSAPIHPAAARTVGYWFHYSSRPLANGLVTAAAVLGVASTYLVFGWLIDRYDWPKAFLIAGAVTGVLALGWTVYARDRPDEKAINATEHASADGPRKDDADRPVDAGPLVLLSSRSLLSNRRIWLLTASYGMLGYFQYLFFYWQEYYFERVLKLGMEQARIYATVPTLAMAFGMVAGGWLFARLERVAAVRVRHAAVPAAGLAFSGLFAVLGVLGNDPLWVLLSFSLAMAAAGLSEGSFWTTAVEIGGSAGGLSSAIMNTGGNAGGALAPMLTPLVASHLGWQGGIALASGFCFLGAALWHWIAPGDKSLSV